MTTEHDVSRIVRSWLEEGGTAMPDRILQAVAAQLPHTKQRQTFGSAWRRIMTRQRLAIAGAGLVALLTIGGYGLTRVTGPIGAVRPTATTQPSPLPAWIGGPPLTAATPYYFAYPQLTTFEVPAGWMYLDTARDRSAVMNDAGTGAVLWVAPTGVYQDPCAWTTSGLVPGLGSDVASLVNALRRLPGVDASPPEATTIGGLAATKFTLTSTVNRLSCDQQELQYWKLTGNGYDTSGTIDVYVMLVHGKRLMLVTWSADAESAVSLEIQSVVDSVAFP